MCDTGYTDVDGVCESGSSSSCTVTTLYSECNYQGESLEVEDTADCLDWDPKSICVADGDYVTIFDLCFYNGDSVTFEESNACFPGAEDTFLIGQKKSKAPTKKHHARVTIE